MEQLYYRACSPGVHPAEHPVQFLTLTGGFRAAVAVALHDDSYMGESDQAKIRICDGCGKPMIYLGKLPQSHGKPAVMIFRCFSCNRVASEPVI